MKKRIYQIDRRTFLRGLGASVVSLPMFDFFLNSNGTAFAQTGEELPKRFLLMMNGISLTRNATNLNMIKPEQTGKNYSLIPALMPFNDHPGVKDHITILSNLYLPYVIRTSSSPPPPGGYKGDFHNVAGEAQLTGLRTGREGPSSDRLLRAQLNKDGKFVHLNYCVQARHYLGGATSSRSPMQFDLDGDRIQPGQSPRAAFNELFFNLQEQNPEQEMQRQLAAAKRKSVLDLISRERVDFLNRELGPKEKSMLSDHFDRIRDIEKSLDQIQEENVVACQKPVEPRDPPIGPDYIGGTNVGDNTNIAYSNEDLRADLFIDLIHMALVCDIARHGTLRMTFNQSYMNTYPISGSKTDYHGLTHYEGSSDGFMRMVRWHVAKYAKLVDKLLKTQEGSGTALDNSVILLASEGGGGPNSDDVDGSISPHSGRNMATMIAGHAGGLKAMGHIRTSEVHPSRVILTGMKAAGFSGNTLGEVSGIIEDLF